MKATRKISSLDSTIGLRSQVRAWEYAAKGHFFVQGPSSRAITLSCLCNFNSVWLLLFLVGNEQPPLEACSRSWPHSKETFPVVLSEPPPVQLYAIPAHPVTGSQVKIAPSSALPSSESCRKQRSPPGLLFSGPGNASALSLSPEHTPSSLVKSFVSLLLAARAHQWPVLNLLLPVTCCYLSPNLYLCLSLVYCWFNTWHFPMLNFMPLLIAYFSDLSRFSCKASHPSREPPALPN